MHLATFAYSFTNYYILAHIIDWHFRTFFFPITKAFILLYMYAKKGNNLQTHNMGHNRINVIQY